MERGQFTFYASYAAAISRIRKKTERCDAYDALVQYALTGEMPGLETLPDVVAMFMEMALPTLDSSRRKAENGLLGGRKNKSESKSEANDEQEQTESKPEANRKQTGSKKEKEKESKREEEREKENECYTPLPSPSSPKPKTATQLAEEITVLWADPLRNAVFEWLAYKKEKGQNYKETGLRAMLTQIQKAAEQYGADAVIDIIHTSMSSNYTGIVFDRLQQGKTSTKRYTTAADYTPPKPTRDALDKLQKALDSGTI